MPKFLEKSLIWLIYLGLAATLAAPLIINNSFFFPFIFPKALIFKAVIEIIFVLYLLLAYLNQKYLPKINILLASIAVFIIFAFISSYLGINFYQSFWGDIERSEGLILWLHLLAYFVILASVLKSEKEWLNFFDFSLAVGLIMSLMAVAQAYNFAGIESAGGQRASAMMGNASFFAAYMLFDLAFAAYMFFKRPQIYRRGIYAALLILFGFVIFKTMTRGAILGLAAGVLVAAILGLIARWQNKKIKAVAISTIVLICLLGGFIYFNRNSGWLSQYPVLSRLASISLQDTTTRNRLVTWQAGWQGWQKNFLLGYGLENFTYVFDKNFPTAIYEDEGSQVWFDRAHNLIFDRGVTTGFVGLALYLLFLFLPLYYLIKEYKKGNYALSLPFIALIIAFFVQDLFVFETITTYIILFFTWVFLSQSFRQYELKNTALARKAALFIFFISAISFWFVFDAVNIKPARANLQAAQAQHLQANNGSLDDFFRAYQQAINLETYGTPEYRIYFLDYFGTKLANAGEIDDTIKPLLAYGDKQAQSLAETEPNDTKSNLVFMRYYNYTFGSLPDKAEERLKMALSVFPKLQALSPTRPQIFREAGYSNLYLYRYYLQNNKTQLAQAAAAEAEKMLKKSAELSPKVISTHNDLIMFYLNTGQKDKINDLLKAMDEAKIEYKTAENLNRLIQLAVGNKNYELTLVFSKDLTESDPKNIESWVNLALAYAYLGQDSKAIETAEHIRQLSNGVQSAQADAFIKQVKDGVFRDKK